jgi:hypothetical protein
LLEPPLVRGWGGLFPWFLFLVELCELLEGFTLSLLLRELLEEFPLSLLLRRWLLLTVGMQLC